jgi:hypothetical protein
MIASRPRLGFAVRGAAPDTPEKLLGARRATRYASLVIGCMLVACSSSSTGSPAGDAPEKACLDTCEAFARARERCGGDYKSSYDAMLASVANGDCKNIVSVRDEATLRGVCLPAVQTIACPDLTNGKLDPSCSQQLQHTASVSPTLARAASVSPTLAP